MRPTLTRYRLGVRPRPVRDATRFAYVEVHDVERAVTTVGFLRRAERLAGWLDYYNQQRPRSGLGRQTPGERLAQLMNNIPGTNT